MKVMWVQLCDPGLFQVLHKSQGWPIHLALLSHLQPQLEFPELGQRSGTRAGQGCSASSLPSSCKGETHPASSSSFKPELLLFYIQPTSRTVNCFQRSSVTNPSLLLPPCSHRHGAAPVLQLRLLCSPVSAAELVVSAYLILILLTYRLEMQHSFLPQSLRYQSKFPRTDTTAPINSPSLHPTTSAFSEPSSPACNN